MQLDAAGRDPVGDWRAADHRRQTFALEITRHGPDLTSGPVTHIVEIVQVSGLLLQVYPRPSCEDLPDSAELNPEEAALRQLVRVRDTLRSQERVAEVLTDQEVIENHFPLAVAYVVELGDRFRTVGSEARNVDVDSTAVALHVGANLLLKLLPEHVGELIKRTPGARLDQTLGDNVRSTTTEGRQAGEPHAGSYLGPRHDLAPAIFDAFV